MVMRKPTITTASTLFGIMLSLSVMVPAVHADQKVHCKPIVKALREGKKPDEVAKELNLPISSVYGCLRKANKVQAERQARLHAEKKGAAAETSPSTSRQSE
jgi:uncharacterized protein (DUF433 family)